MSVAGRSSLNAYRYVHRFDSAADNVTLLGGKGASLARMKALGLPIPPGFTVSTDGWRAWRDRGEAALEEVLAEIRDALTHLEEELGRGFGDPDNPLLVSVRSGAPRSMPGMMDTILNLGLTSATVAGLAAQTTPEFAHSLHARLLAMYGRIVLDVPAELVQPLERGADAAAVRELASVIEAHCGRPVPDTPQEQLAEAVIAVWRSWDSRRARRYRRYAGIPDDLGTAVTVQAMVFGNRDDASGTGVVFTRDPATGSPSAYGDFLARAQGEDVVAGGRNTEPLEAMQYRLPDAYRDLDRALPAIEAAYRDMTDVEFTVESGRLWILQARPGQRSGPAAVRIAVDLVDEGLIDVDEALERIPASAIEQLQAPVFATREGLDIAGRGTPAAPGAAVGAAAFDSERAIALCGEGRPVVLLRPETSPEDIGGMIAAAGIVTAVGGRTSHAAVVARGIGRPAVCGVSGLEIDPAARTARTPDGRRLQEGDVVAVDGNEGLLVLGDVKLVPAQPDQNTARMLAWCDERQRIPIVSEAPDGYARVGSPEEAAALSGGGALVDVPWEGASSALLLDRIVAAAIDAGCDRLALRLPETLAGADLRPPEGPWTHLVVTPGKDWAARLLAARVACSPAAAR
jgi:pyruvate,orthophosphate dikinase